MKPNRYSASGLNRRVLLSAFAALPTLIGPLRSTSALAQAPSIPVVRWSGHSAMYTQ